MLIAMLAIETGWGYFICVHLLLGFLNNFWPLAGFLLNGDGVAPFIKVEFYDSTNPV